MAFSVKQQFERADAIALGRETTREADPRASSQKDMHKRRYALALAAIILIPVAPISGPVRSQPSSCSALAPDKIRALELAIERQIASLEDHLKRLELPDGDLDPEARRELRTRYRNLLADARTAQQDFHKTVKPLAAASLPQEICTIQNGEMQ